ncbi:MAG: thioredoxin family protein [Anaerolineales bacterium]|jgi:thioredoxin-related protein
MKPIVDELESEFAGKLEVIRLNVQSSVGRELAGQYDFRYTPTFIFFDAQGNELWRAVGQLKPEQVRAAMKP